MLFVFNGRKKKTRTYTTNNIIHTLLKTKQEKACMKYTTK